MRIVFLGTPDFAIKSLEKLIESNHQIVGVVTQVDKPNGRGKKLVYSPVKEYAIKHNLPLYQFAKISRDGVDVIKNLKPDIMVTAAYGQLLSEQIISIPRYGIINVHGSILPKYRGASPIQSAIINGETVSGVTIMQTDIGLDTGDILDVKTTEIGKYETYGQLSEKLAVIGAELLIETLSKIEENNINPIKQNSVDATITKKITKNDCIINWNKSAIQIKNLIYGVNPDPVAYTYLNDIPVKIYTANIDVSVESNEASAVPGEILDCSSAKNGVFVKTGNGIIMLGNIQFPGGKVLDAKQFISGRKLKVGDVFESSLKIE